MSDSDTLEVIVEISREFDYLAALRRADRIFKSYGIKEFDAIENTGTDWRWRGTGVDLDDEN